MINKLKLHLPLFHKSYWRHMSLLLTSQWSSNFQIQR